MRNLIGPMPLIEQVYGAAPCARGAARGSGGAAAGAALAECLPVIRSTIPALVVPARAVTAAGADIKAVPVHNW